MYLKKLLLCCAVTSSMIGCADNNSTKAEHNHSSSDSTSQGASKKSIPSETKKWVGNTDIKINYHSPGVRGRVIWGGLVAYDSVWVTGAHSATTLEIGKDFIVAGKTIPAGKYALFTIPSRDEWTIIINKNWEQHLADEYSESDDVVRLKVKPEAGDAITERLKYEIDQKGERLADIIIRWEKLSVRFDLEIR